MDPSITQQIKQVEEQLRRQAQQLGHLNLKNNDFLQQNQKLALQIVQLRNKINKKKHTIDQQKKDKMIIHEKLVKAQREKELLQIEHHRKRQLEIAKQKQLELQEQQLSRISTEMKAVNIQGKSSALQAAVNHASILVKQQSASSSNYNEQQQNLVTIQSGQQHQDYQQKLSNHQKTSTQQKPAQQSKTNNQHYAEQTDRGEYQPPMLFLQTQQKSQKSKSNPDSQEDDQIDEEMMAKLKAAAQEDQEEDEDQQ